MLDTEKITSYFFWSVSTFNKKINPAPDKNFKLVLFTCNRADFDARELLQGITSHPATSHWIMRVHSWPQSDGQWQDWMAEFEPDGIIIFSPLSTWIHESLRVGDRPHVFLTWGIDLVDDKTCVLLPDEEAVGAAAAKHFLDRKFEHFAVVSYLSISHMVSRKRGFLKTLRRYTSTVPAYDGDLQASPLKPYGEHIPKDFYEWLARLPKPCALFACDDEIGAVVVEACRYLHIKVPREIAVLGAGNNGQVCRIIAPRLSSVGVPFVEIGHKAAGVLDQWMAGTTPKFGCQLFRPREVIVRSSTEINETHDPVVASALEYISAHLGEHLRVTDLQRLTGVSAKTLETRFKTELRRTPVEEIRRQRIEHSKQLLRETDLSVTQVALQCGFKQAHKFSTVFKAFTDQRPSEYRRRYEELR